MKPSIYSGNENEMWRCDSIKERELKLINVEWSKNYKFSAYFFNRSIHGRDSYRLDPATSIQEQKCAVYRTLPVLISVFADCLKCHFSISFSEEIVRELAISKKYAFQVGQFLDVISLKNVASS